MTQKDKNLLLKDLCGRLPYGVKANISAIRYEKNQGIVIPEHIGMFQRGNTTIKPYLRSMSSMTEKEKKELERLIDEKLNRNTDQEDDEWIPWVLYDTTGIKNYIGGERFYFDEMGFIYDWLNAHHFDYRGLIPMDLAFEALEGMY